MKVKVEGETIMVTHPSSIGYKMPKILKNKWVRALKSGKFVQDKDQLYTGNTRDGKPKMCCLGVLECVMGTDMNRLHRGMPWNGSNAPKVFRGSRNENLTIGDVLAKLNDASKSYKRVIGFIEKNL